MIPITQVQIAFTPFRYLISYLGQLGLVVPPGHFLELCDVKLLRSLELFSAVLSTEFAQLAAL